MSERKILIIAGPNGAGKTTFAQEFLPEEAKCPHFVNADLIAAGLSPFSPELAAVRAGRIILEQIHEHVRKGESFAFETTLSGRIYLRLIPDWQAQGYVVKLFFLQLPSPEMAVARVRQRVAAGGHNVPEDVIRRRFDAGRAHFESSLNRWLTSGFYTIIRAKSRCVWTRDTGHEQSGNERASTRARPGFGEFRSGAAPCGTARA